eukprot:c16629_g1_i1.p1 GENE.c16629_g1_i1~~c16629_g1_i1.p1  ORF type:complete len:475 (+),score=233.14 c16629_g1_i1:25-1425(+)
MLKQLINLPGPKSVPQLGTLGDMFARGGLQNMISIHQQYLKEFGTVVKQELGESNHEVLVYHPASYTPVLQQEGKYPYGSAVLFWPFLNYWSSRGVVQPLSKIGPEWSERRRQLQPDLFPPNVASTYLSLLSPVTKEISDNIPSWQNKSIPDYINRAAFDMFTSVMFGSSLHTVSPNATSDNLEFVHHAQNAMSLAGHLFMMPEQMAPQETVKSFEGSMDIVRKHGAEITKQALEGNKNDKSYSQRLLKRNELSPDLISHQLTDLLFAGVDTTSHVFLWALLNVAQNPEVQEKLANELKLNTVDGEVTEENFGKLVYLEAVMRESHRYTPPSSVSTTKVLDRDIVIEDYFIPKGVKITMLQNLQRSDLLVDDPDRFMPERFSPEQKAARKGTPKEALDHVLLSGPFSAGARMCLGARIAKIEIAALLSRLVYNYRISQADKNSQYDVVSKLFSMATPFPNLTFEKR